MAYEENLIPVTERTKEEAREISRKGGIASGKARRKKANLKRTLEALLKMDIPDAKLKRQLEELGLDPSMEQGLALSVLLTTIKKGNMKDLSILMEMLQQTATPADKREQKARTERLQQEVKNMEEESARKSGQTHEKHIGAQTQAIAEMINNPESERVLTDFMGRGNDVQEAEDDADTNSE